MTEFYVSRHLQSKLHFTKKYFKKKHYKAAAREKRSCKTPEKQTDEFQIQGDTIQKCRHNHTNIVRGVQRLRKQSTVITRCACSF